MSHVLSYVTLNLKSFMLNLEHNGSKKIGTWPLQGHVKGKA